MACKECGDALTRKEARELGVLADWPVRKYHGAQCSSYVGKTHPSKKPTRAAQAAAPKMPSFVTEQHRAIGCAKVSCALEHLDDARNSLDAACRDLCSVIGGNRAFRDASKLSDQTRDLRKSLGLELQFEPQFALDRAPVPDDFVTPHLKGCGHKPLRDVLSLTLLAHGIKADLDTEKGAKLVDNLIAALEDAHG